MASDARLSTPSARTYVSHLCALFERETDVTRWSRRGQIDFLDGTCTLVARPGALALRVEADDAETVARLAEAVGRRLAEGGGVARLAWSPVRASRPTLTASPVPGLAAQDLDIDSRD